MRIIRRWFRRDIVVVAENELDLVDWSTVNSGCIYLDVWGALHFELHHKGFLHGLHNTNWIDLFFRQHRLYRNFPRQALAASRSLPLADVIGVRQFVYLRGARILGPSGVAILPWSEMIARGDPDRNPNVGAIRRTAFAKLFAALDDVAVRLGALIAFMPTSEIADEKMRHYGCRPHAIANWRERLLKWMLTFPLRGQRVYVKLYK